MFSVFNYIVILHVIKCNLKMKKVLVLLLFMLVSSFAVAQSETPNSSTEITVDQEKEMDDVKKKVDRAEAKAKKEKKEAAAKKKEEKLKKQINSKEKSISS